MIHEHIPENDPSLRSFVEVAEDSHFPIQNLPFGVFRRPGQRPRVGVAIGDSILDLSVAEEAGLFSSPALRGGGIFAASSLNPLLSLGRDAWRQARSAASALLRSDEPAIRDNAVLRDSAIVRQSGVEMLLPVEIGAYTDFYSSREHASNVGAMFRGKDNALLPNWSHIPIAYDGRASTIVASGTDFHRPRGQIRPSESEPPIFEATRQLDFELEVAFVLGRGNPHGQPVPVSTAHEHVFGMLLLNDWSARDVQKWEYVPLGPFLAKNFCTSVSPWIVTMDALEPFRIAARLQDPAPLPYLASSRDRVFDLRLEVGLATARLESPHTITRTSYSHIYWDFCQQLAHHTSNGCGMRPGDIFASGTISGPEPDSFGSLLELTWAGKNPIRLPNGEERKFLEDGDSVIMTGYCAGKGYRVGFGEVRGTVLPALASISEVAG